MSANRVRSIVVSSVVAAACLVVPAASQAYFAKGNGPFRPASDCGKWSASYAGQKKRSCAYHYKTVVHHGIQYSMQKSGNAQGQWQLFKRTYGKRDSQMVNTYYSGAHRVGPGLYTLWLNASFAARTCVLTQSEFSTSTSSGVVQSPWQHGYDSNKRCP